MKINSEQIIAISIFHNYKLQLDIYYRKSSNLGYLSSLLFSLLYFSLSIFNNSSNSLTACSIEK